MEDTLDIAAFLDRLANTLDHWAHVSSRYGWSTHQVQDNKTEADNCRRMAAIYRSRHGRSY